MNKRQTKMLMVLVLSCALLLSSIYKGYSVTYEEVIHSSNETNTNANSNYDGMDLTDIECCGEIDDDIERLVFPLVSDTDNFASKYDPRDSGIITSIKNQGPFGLCWMYTSTALVETFVSKNYGSLFDISELHGGVCKSNILDKYNVGVGYNNREYYSGGHFSLAAQYFTNWNEPVYSNYKWNSIIDESLYPQDNFINLKDGKPVKKENSEIEIDDSFENSKSLFNVTDMGYIANDEISLKNAIEAYGSVYVKTSLPASVLATDHNNDIAKYSSKIDLGHAVALIGWDDNYSRFNFRSDLQPENDGAWLAKNSWGSNDSNTGFVWISYEDASTKFKNTAYVVTGVQRADDSEHMLSYDFISMGDKNKYVNSKVVFSNVFEIENFYDEYEEINKVLFYLKCQDCAYNIKITQIEDTLPNDISDLPILSSGRYNGEGYLTEKLNYPYKFISNNKCAVFLEVIPNSPSSKVYLPCEHIRSFINRGESLYCIDPINGSIQWRDVLDENDYNKSGSFCIRPVLKKENNNHYVEIKDNVIIDTKKDNEIEYNSDSYLFNIHTSANILRENRDYIRLDNKIIFKSSYLQSLKGKYTEIILDFNNDMSRTVIVNPKAKITGVQVTGKYVVGKELTVDVEADLIKENYDIEYQWQSSPNGTDWYDINHANEKQYILTNNELLRYIRVVIKSANKYGNVEYPSSATSKSSITKCVVLGDADLDGYVNIDDATNIQKYLVSLEEFNIEQKVAADVNEDGNIAIDDATAIQKMIVQEI